MRPRTRPPLTTGVVALLVFLATACRADDGANVRRVDGTSGGVSGSVSGSASGSASGSSSATGVAGAAGAGMGGYRPGSNVAGLSAISSDACDISGLMPAGRTVDYAQVQTVYAGGPAASPSPAEAGPTLQGLAVEAADTPLRALYAGHFRDPRWLDAYMSAAVGGSGPFAGQGDAVRRAAILGTVQHQIPVSAMFHALDTARVRIKGPGNVIPETGAPHYVDRAWALFHGANPTCAPFGSAKSTGRVLGTRSTLNDRIRAQMASAQAASLSGNADRLGATADEITRLVTAVYVQAVVVAAKEMDEAVGFGDAGGAKGYQAQGDAAFRTIEPVVARADAAAARMVAGAFDLRSQPASRAGAGAVDALRSALGKLGIAEAEVGTLQRQGQPR